MAWLVLNQLLVKSNDRKLLLAILLFLVFLHHRCYGSHNRLRGIQSSPSSQHFGGGATSSFDGIILTLKANRGVVVSENILMSPQVIHKVYMPLYVI